MYVYLYIYIYIYFILTTFTSNVQHGCIFVFLLVLYEYINYGLLPEIKHYYYYYSCMKIFLLWNLKCLLEENID